MYIVHYGILGACNLTSSIYFLRIKTLLHLNVFNSHAPIFKNVLIQCLATQKH